MSRLPVVLLLVLGPSSAFASPVMWAWAGTITNDTGLNTMPVGTPLRLTYYADSSAPNACGAGAATGLYTGGHAVLGVQSTAGLLTYTASSSYLWANAFGTLGCGTATGFTELLFSGWEGPSIPCPSTCSQEQTVVGGIAQGSLAPGGLYFLGQPLNDPRFPIDQPISAYMQGPWFNLSESGMVPPLQRAIVSQDMRAVPAPEPSALLLFGLGLAVIAMRRIKAIRSGLRVAPVEPRLGDRGR